MVADRGMAFFAKATVQEETKVEENEATGLEERVSGCLFSSNAPRFFEWRFVQG